MKIDKPVVGLDFDGVLVIGLILPVPGIKQFIKQLKQAGCQPIVVTARGGLWLRIAEYLLRIIKVKMPLVGNGAKPDHLKRIDAFFYIESSRAKIRDLKNEVPEVHFAWFFAYSSYLPLCLRKLMKKFLVWSGFGQLFSFPEKRFSSLDELLTEVSAKLNQT